MSERKVLRAQANLAEQIDNVIQAISIAEPYLDPEIVDLAADVISRGEERRRLSGEHVVIGLFGATGSGKSSLFNAVTGTSIARTGVIRPTTTRTVAAVWQPDGSGELLDWLEVDERHVISNPLADVGTIRSTNRGEGLILLDLPDMDSTSLEHHQIATRLAGQVDYLVWVFDPQKYADASIHRGYLNDLTGQHGNLLVVLNQIDLVAQADRGVISRSLSNLLASEGLGEVPVLQVSASTGEGVKALRQAIGKAADNKALATRRLKADLDTVVRKLDADLSVRKVHTPDAIEQVELCQRVAAAHGAGHIADAAATSYKLRASARTGWPITNWLVRLRSDPLKRLHLGQSDKQQGAMSLTSRLELSVAEQAAAGQAVNSYVRKATEELPDRWAEPLQDELAGTSQRMEPDIDLAIAGTPLGVERGSWWWPVVRLTQWLALAVALSGALWLGGIALAGYFQFSLPDTPRVEGIAIPTLMVFTGVLLGIVLGILISFVNRMAAKIKRSKALKLLERSVSGVVRQAVIEPVAQHLDRYNTYAAAVTKAVERAE